MPSRPPDSTTQIFGDIATATRIESTENAMFTSSTFTTVAHSADRPSHGWRPAGPCCAPRRFAAAEEVLVRQIQQVEAADELHDADADEVGGQQRRDVRNANAPIKP